MGRIQALAKRTAARGTVVKLLIVVIFVFINIHVLSSSRTEDASSPNQSGRTGWSAWKRPGFGDKEKYIGQWADSQSEASKDGGKMESDSSPVKQTTGVPKTGSKAKPGTDNNASDGNVDNNEQAAKPPDNNEQAAKPPEPPAESQPTCPSDEAHHARLLPVFNTTFEVPDDIFYDPKGPRADQIVFLTASDGGGYNGDIANIVEHTRANRQAYCNYHGYQYHFINVSKYDLDGADPVWKKVPAIIETFNTYPDAQWVWMLDLDAIVMTPTVDLRDILLSQNGLQQALRPRSDLHNTGIQGLGLSLPDQVDFTKIDFLISQDHNGINTGSFFVRRSHFSQIFMDIWADPFLLKMDWGWPEQDALTHLIRNHFVVRQHLGIIKQRVSNAYFEGGPEMIWQDGDLAVHFAGCWVGNHCSERWDSMWARRSEVPSVR